jgi:hypothetical protein
MRLSHVIHKPQTCDDLMAGEFIPDFLTAR